jgi:hypothetical protein
MSDNVLSLPQSACAYEIYDPETLEPQNESTYIRLMELGWTEAEFKDRTVLDIGANTGILSLRAHQLGASSIQSVDVQVPLVEFFTGVVQRHKLPIRVERRGFFDLDPAQHAADVVCFMEVLHWIVDQGGSVEHAVGHLATLTRETLYLETPWDIKEPSIARKGIVTEAQYNIELIVRELSRHFAEVRMVRFMTYFGNMKDSKRVLIRAAQRRPASLPLSGMADANLLDISMMRGASAVELVTTLKGPKVLKRLPPSCTLARLDDAGLEVLCKFLASIPRATLAPPERIGAGYRYKAEDGRYYMLFPFVGRLGDFFPARKLPRAVTSPLDVALAVRDDLRKAPAAVIDVVRQISHPCPLGDIDAISGDIASAVAEAGLADFCRASFARASALDRGHEEALIHNDMQIGNMVINQQGNSRMVDIDLLRTGTPYQDLLTCAIYNGVDADTLRRAIVRQAKDEARTVTGLDIDVSVANTVAWLTAFGASGKAMSKRQLSIYLSGLRSMEAVSRELAP